MQSVQEILKNSGIVAISYLLGVGLWHADRVFGTPMWMSVITDAAMLPTMAGIAILMSSPNFDLLKTRTERFVALLDVSAGILMRKISGLMQVGRQVDGVTIALRPVLFGTSTGSI
jgi:hypothetical protein